MFKEKVWFKDGVPSISEVSFQLLACDWLKLQESPEWIALEEKLRALQKEYIHSLPLIREYKLEVVRSINAKKKFRYHLHDLFHRK